jgi:oligopeptide/dipeptide ABC transporter ATP-binding protein
LRSTPRVDVVLDRLVAIDGAPPDLRRPPQGCGFAARCPHRVVHCREEVPELLPIEHHGDGRNVACFRAEELLAPTTPVAEPVR